MALSRLSCQRNGRSHSHKSGQPQNLDAPTCMARPGAAWRPSGSRRWLEGGSLAHAGRPIMSHPPTQKNMCTKRSLTICKAGGAAARARKTDEKC